MPQAKAGEAQAHLPFTQVKFVPQVLPQAPQLLLLVLVLTHVKPAAAEPQQVVPIGHLVQLPPQLPLELVEVQDPPQLVVPGGHPQVPAPVQTPPLGHVVHTPLQQVRPLQHPLEVEHVPFCGTHLFDGAVGDDPEVGVLADASPSEGAMAPATPAIRTFSALRRESGFASFFASSSKRSSLIPSLLTSYRPGSHPERTLKCPLVEKFMPAALKGQRVKVTQTMR